MVHSTLYIINDIQLNLHSPSEYTVAVNFDSANDPLEGLVTYIIPEDKLPKELKKRVNALNLQGYEDGFVHADKNTLESICELFKEYVDLKNIYKDAENNPDAYEMSPNVMFDHLDALKNLIDKCLEDSYLTCNKLYSKFGKDSEESEESEDNEDKSDQEDEKDEEMEEENKEEQDNNESDSEIMRYLRNNLKNRLKTSAVIDEMIKYTDDVNNAYQNNYLNSDNVIILQLVRYNIRECE